MAQLVDLVNRAFARIGAEPIAALTPEDSPQAAIAIDLAQPRIDALLADFPWRFAMQTKQLSRVAEPMPAGSPYQYQYAIPTDCLRLYKTDKLSAHYEIHAQPGGAERRLYSNETEVWADMVLRIEAGLFPPHFEQAATAALAGELAMPITRDPKLADYYEKRAEVLLSRAKVHDANEQPWEELDDGNYLADARYGL